jgi:ACS family hexuronate transporter-like MFS transporter
LENDLLNSLPVSRLRQTRKTQKRGRVRWWIAWTLFFSTVTNYLSRQTFSMLSPVIAVEYHLRHSDIGKILGAFQLSYAITWLLGGIFLDAVGARLGLALAACFWSVVSILTGFAHSVFGFGTFRFLLGIGEALNWPGASKTVAEWFPREERSLAVAIFDSGSSVGGALAALTIPWIAIVFGWRWSFVFSGGLGLVWLIVWLKIYRPLHQNTRVTEEEFAFILSGQDTPQKSASFGMQRWLSLLKDSNCWGIVLGRALTDPVWWFYVFWLPQYLSDARGFSLQRIAIFTWMPFLAADAGNFTGGLISGYCIRRGLSVVRARIWICAFSSFPVLGGIPAAYARNEYVSIGLICIALWGYASWSTMGLTLPSDLFPQDLVATVTGLSGFVAGIGGAIFMYAIGVMVDRFSYRPAFIVAGLLPTIATLCLYALIRKDQKGSN